MERSAIAEKGQWIRFVWQGSGQPPGPSTANINQSPSLSFALLLFLCALLLHSILLYSVGRSPFEIASDIYDNSSYLDIAGRLQIMNFTGFEPIHFWGLPLAIVFVSKLLHVPEVSALLLISLAGGFLGVYFTYRLYGGFVAALFAIGNYTWLTFCAEGSSEPLFASLLFAGLLCCRRQHWVWSGMILGLATIVRPVGIFALMAAGLVLLFQRKFREFASIAIPAGLIGVAYLTLLRVAAGDAFIQFKSYSSLWGGGWWPFSWPIAVAVNAAAELPQRLPGVLTSITWIVLTFLGLVAIAVGRPYRELWRVYPIEALFGLIYVLFFASFNRIQTGEGGIDPRLIGPIVPLLLVSFGRWAEWPKLALAGAGVLSGVLSACAMGGMRAVLGFGLP